MLQGPPEGEQLRLNCGADCLGGAVPQRVLAVFVSAEFHLTEREAETRPLAPSRSSRGGDSGPSPPARRRVRRRSFPLG